MSIWVVAYIAILNRLVSNLLCNWRFAITAIINAKSISEKTSLWLLITCVWLGRKRRGHSSESKKSIDVIHLSSCIIKRI
ncbi:hypothetical protein COCVIDRAFT_111924 [Bipolaris victoriae FI3]|uniref:Uncharacterized protein n=1 Tax=Bipolaris victoriae (strain FI3) TaxID=930091 RepID=W7EDG4_BIPV3|nr:hypothetical protein COCVIDRAFT_111924 [Bipolaris victoriae FI3]